MPDIMINCMESLGRGVVEVEATQCYTDPNKKGCAKVEVSGEELEGRLRRSKIGVRGSGYKGWGRRWPLSPRLLLLQHIKN